MNTNHKVKKVIVGALLSGGVALAGFGLTAGTAHAFRPQPEPPGSLSSPLPQPLVAPRQGVKYEDGLVPEGVIIYDGIVPPPAFEPNNRTGIITEGRDPGLRDPGLVPPTPAFDPYRTGIVMPYHGRSIPPPDDGS